MMQSDDGIEGFKHYGAPAMTEGLCPTCDGPMETVDGVTRCPDVDCRPDCSACKGRGWYGMGNTCETCKGMGTLGWTENEITNETMRRGEAADEAALNGGSEQRAYVTEAQDRIMRTLK